MNNNRVSELFKLYHNRTATRTETDELMGLLENASDEELSAILKKTWDKLNGDQVFFTPGLREKMLAKIQPAEEAEATIPQIGHVQRSWFLRVAAAAAIVVVLSTTAFFLFRKDDDQIVQTEQNKPVVNDVAPGGDRAILTLADGRKIILDTASNGNLAQQDGIKVIKIGGQVAYTPSTGGEQGEVLYNTITTPKGGQYQLVLADGSKVSLNAASSLRFPAAFVGTERTVELTGEGYFEVAHNAEMPFHVKVNEMDVQVLGTRFNINSYGNEPSLKTTLLEGKVRVAKGKNHVNLNAGQQAITSLSETAIKINNDVDVDEAVAWMNGKFLFNRTDVETIMRQIERWYNVEVSYQGNITKETFSGIVDRNSNVSQILKIMEEGGMKFKIEGRRITVMH